MISCQPLEITRGPVNSVLVNQVTYMYIQFTGSTSPPLSPASVQLINQVSSVTSRVTPLRDISCRRALGLHTVTPPSKHKATQPMLSTKAFNQCCFNVCQRRRSWPNIETVLGECLVFAGRTASYFYRS